MLVSEFKAPAEPGLNKAAWDMTIRRPLSQEEKKAMMERMRRLQEAGGSGGQADLNYAYDPAGAGFYRLVLTVDGKESAARAEIIEDTVRD
jgi:microcompartment protein CcmK/EutM